MPIQNKFDTISSEDGLLYVSAKIIADVYKTLHGKSGTTQKKLVKELQVHSFMITWSRHKDESKKGTIATKLMSQFKSQVHAMYISVNDLETPKDGPNKQNHIKLLRLIEELPDINQTILAARSQINVEPVQFIPASAPIVEPMDETEQVTPTAETIVDPMDETEQVIPTAETIVDPMDETEQVTLVAAPVVEPEFNDNHIPMPIIELKEHEMFRDADNNIFPIEVRGERSKDKILFKAKDVAAFADNERLIKTILDDRKAYQYGIDYRVLEANANDLYMNQIIPKNLMAPLAPSKSPSKNLIALVVQSNSSVNGRGINHDHVYLTLAGLIRVAAVSRNANANLVKLFEWFVHLFYVHQFGSREERNELAQSLFKQVLNDQLAGLYCIDLGAFNDLYDSMNISRETYPPEKYGGHHLYKFGLSKDIGDRLTQHKNKTNGYGRWCKHVLLKWVILIPESKLSAAETMLSDKLNSAKLSFDYIDCNGKNHKELFAIDPIKHTGKVKVIYKQILSHYQTEENRMCEIITSLQTTHDLSISELHREYAQKLSESNEAKLKAEHKVELIKEQQLTLKAEHKVQLIASECKVEILQMQLKLAKAGLL